jgi:hypothetical protein
MAWGFVFKIDIKIRLLRAARDDASPTWMALK